jgi:hypothetical protein
LDLQIARPSQLKGKDHKQSLGEGGGGEVGPIAWQS